MAPAVVQVRPTSAVVRRPRPARSRVRSRVRPRVGWPLVRAAGALVVLLLIGRQVGAGPFHAGLRAVTWPGLALAFTLTLGTTVCSAWRWRVVARSLGADIPLPYAVGAYYRSQLLNSVLPGGVLGDVNRAVAHGHGTGDLGRGLRAVAWERFSGQVVQGVVTAVVLVATPSPMRPAARIAVPLIAAVAVTGGAALALRRGRERGRGRRRAALAILVDDLRGLLAPSVWPRLAVASALVVVGHATVFVLAARLAGCTIPLGELLALAMLVQTSMVIPLSIGGWGPREGVAAWAFAAAGAGAAIGVTVTTVYAVLALAAVAPGVALLVRDAVRGAPGVPVSARDAHRARRAGARCR